MHGIAARLLIVAASLWTAGLQLFSPSSLAFRAAGDSQVLDAINVVILGIAGLAAVDLLWHDLLRRGLIWPSFPERKRHHICVAVYSALAAAFGIRAFIAAGELSTALQVGSYYVLIAAGIAMEAAAIANEDRKP
jgi:hypothetical protein